MRSAAGDDLDAKAVIEELRLYVPTVKVKERLANQLSLRALEGKAIPVNFQHIAYQRMTTTSGTSPRLVIHSASKRPRYVLVAVQPSANIATHSGVNGHVYASTSPSEAYLSVNGQMYPFHKYATASEGATREIANIKALFGKASSDCSMIIRPANFTTMNTIFAFDCSHVQDLFEENSNANINMQFYFTSTENGAQTFHAILISDEYMKFGIVGGALSLASAN